MDIPTKIPVPDYVYRFYQNAAKGISGQTTEKIMADALAAYAALLSDEILKIREASLSKQMKDQS